MLYEYEDTIRKGLLSTWQVVGYNYLMNKNKDSINVYWSENYDINDANWSFLYQKPTSLFSDLNATKEKISDNFLTCPAVSNKFKKTLVFKNSLSSSYLYNSESITPTTNNYIGVTKWRDSSLNCGPIYKFSSSICLFSEEPLDAFFTPPYFHKPGYIKYGACIPGEYDIGQWYRPYHFEVQMWENDGEFHIKENEPLYYINFKTDKKINLYRFNNSKLLTNYYEACIGATSLFGRGQSLISRYNRFKQVGLKEKILTEIKKNLIEEEPYQF